ncbi:MAG: hypothetical protein E7171_05445 [Firmicutes bacterium]|nr:hypothetical protein [Bacillota bacterium]
MSEEEIIIANMLIHGHDTDIKLIELSDKLIDLAVMLAKDEEYEKSEFKATYKQPKLILRDSKVFLRNKFILHKVPYADEVIIKLKLHGRLVRSENELVKLYNGVGRLIDPFELPVRFVNEPYYYGNVSLCTNISDNPEFLKHMKIFFKSIELGHKTNDMTGVCYVHEIVHTQLESIKGIVKDYYNSELLSIFMELVYAYEKGVVLLRETLKNRINMFLTEFHSLYNFISSKDITEDGLWHNVIACKYIVSTVKAFHLFCNYYIGDDIEKNNILWEIQSVFSGRKSLEDVLDILGITYQNSLEQTHIQTLIEKTKTP